MHAKEQWVLHQISALDADLENEDQIDPNRRPRGRSLLSQVFREWKYALVRKGPHDPRERVGKAELHGGGSTGRRAVANIVVQLARRAHSHYGADDGPDRRAERFESALADFERQAKALDGGLKSVAMPKNIGCGKQGGDERAYRAVIDRFAARTRVRVVLYDHEAGATRRGKKKKRRRGQY